LGHALGKKSRREKKKKAGRLRERKGGSARKRGTKKVPLAKKKNLIAGGAKKEIPGICQRKEEAPKKHHLGGRENGPELGGIKKI